MNLRIARKYGGAACEDAGAGYLSMRIYSRGPCSVPCLQNHAVSFAHHAASIALEHAVDLEDGRVTAYLEGTQTSTEVTAFLISRRGAWAFASFHIVWDGCGPVYSWASIVGHVELVV